MSKNWSLSGDKEDFRKQEKPNKSDISCGMEIDAEDSSGKIADASTNLHHNCSIFDNLVHSVNFESMHQNVSQYQRKESKVESMKSISVYNPIEGSTISTSISMGVTKIRDRRPEDSASKIDEVSKYSISNDVPSDWGNRELEKVENQRNHNKEGSHKFTSTENGRSSKNVAYSKENLKQFNTNIKPDKNPPSQYFQLLEDQIVHSQDMPKEFCSEKKILHETDNVAIVRKLFNDNCKKVEDKNDFKLQGKILNLHDKRFTRSRHAEDIQGGVLSELCDGAKILSKKPHQTRNNYKIKRDKPTKHFFGDSNRENRAYDFHQNLHSLHELSDTKNSKVHADSFSNGDCDDESDEGEFLNGDEIQEDFMNIFPEDQEINECLSSIVNDMQSRFDIVSEEMLNRLDEMNFKVEQVENELSVLHSRSN